MANDLEIVKDPIDEFKKIQKIMFLAKEEHADKTYVELKEEYLLLKAILNVANVDLTELDEIKEA
jgi:tRNA splicing ligase